MQFAVSLHLMYDLTGDRLKGSEEELAGAVGAVGVEEGDSEWSDRLS